MTLDKNGIVLRRKGKEVCKEEPKTDPIDICRWKGQFLYLNLISGCGLKDCDALLAKLSELILIFSMSVLEAAAVGRHTPLAVPLLSGTELLAKVAR